MRVNVDEQAINEPRIKHMAWTLAEQHDRPIHHLEVLGRLVAVWMLCYTRRTAVLRIRDIDTAAELPGFAQAMIADELAETVEADGYVYVKGVTERIAFLERQSARGKRGGQAKGNNAQERLLFDDLADAKRTLAERIARGKRSLKQEIANSLAPDLDQAPDQAPDHKNAQIASDASREQSAPAPLPDDSDASQGKPAREVPDQALTLAWLLLHAIIRNHPSSRIAKAPAKTQEGTAAKWAVTIDKLQRLDKFSWAEIEGMIHWSQRHSFWQGVILGADNLRDKWDKMAAQRNGGKPNGHRPQQQSAFDVLNEHAAELERREQQEQKQQPEGKEQPDDSE